MLTSQVPIPLVTEGGLEMARIVKTADVRREELLDTALRLFAERGYHDTSVQAITDAAAVAKGLFYHYFSSKEDLLDELAVREADRVFAAVHAAHLDTPGTPLEQLAALMGMLSRWLFDDARGLTAALLHAAYRDGNAGLRDTLFGRYDELLRPLLAEHVEEAVAAGQADVEDAEATTEVLLAMWSGLRERQMRLLLELGDRRDRIDVLVREAEAGERAAERILGAAEGTLHIYDHATIACQLLALAEAEEPRGA